MHNSNCVYLLTTFNILYVADTFLFFGVEIWRLFQCLVCAGAEGEKMYGSWAGIHVSFDWRWQLVI